MLKQSMFRKHLIIGLLLIVALTTVAFSIFDLFMREQRERMHAQMMQNRTQMEKEFGAQPGFPPPPGFRPHGPPPGPGMMPPPPPPEMRRGLDPRWTLFGLVGLAILLSSGISFYLLFSAFRAKAVVVEDVISQLQHGNLKARFPVTKLDEVGRIMLLFNKMADEIERTVLSLRDNERARVHLMQELAHDLRTPVASLKNFLEVLNLKYESMTAEMRKDFFEMSLKEIDYFEKLVEDLLFLGQVLEPKYKQRTQDVNLEEVLRGELKIIKSKYPQIHGEISVGHGLGDAPITVTGDKQQLQRLFRNGLENAFSFSKSQVIVRVSNGQGTIIVDIEDDGPGASEEDLQQFGQKRKSRKIDSSNDRVSVGLGSLIMATIAQSHNGEIGLQNRKNAPGAHLKIKLSKT